MHFATLLTLILLTILALSVRLLLTFSYNTFIPLDMEFGVFLYFVCVFMLYFGRKYYFYKNINSSVKKLHYFDYVVIPTLLSIVIAFVILFNFKVRSNYYGIGEDGMAAAVRQSITYIMLFSGSLIISMFLFISGNIKFNAVSENNINKYTFPFNHVIKKFSSFYIPVLILTICYTLFLAYSDYKSFGMKHGYTNKNNVSVMYKKAQDNQDITYCDHIINTRDIKYSIERCYIEFFDKNEERKRLVKLGNRNKLTMKDYLALYKKIKNQQCLRSNSPSLCEDLFLKETSFTLKKASKKKVIFGADKTPKYLLISVLNAWANKDIHNYLIKDLQTFKKNSINLIEKSHNDEERIYTEIYIDIRKLAEYEDDLKSIDKIIAARSKFLYNKQIEKNRLQHQQAKLKREKERLEFENKMRKKHKIKSNATIQPCKGYKYFENPCLKAMCVDGEFVYNIEYKFYIPQPSASSVSTAFRPRRRSCTEVLDKNNPPVFENK